MKMSFCLLASLCLYLTKTTAQERAYSTGDRVPNIAFNTVLNYPNPTAKLATLKKKITLIDFWQTGCGTCIKKIPEWDALQKKYPNQFAVLLVSTAVKDTKEKVSKVLNRIAINTGNQLGLPVVLGDSLLKQSFPNEFVPYYALLDDQLLVLAVGDDEIINPEKVETFLKNRNSTINAGFTAAFPQNSSFTGTISDAAPILFQSSIHAYNPDARPGKAMAKDSKGNVTSLTLTNQSLLEMIQTAYGYHALPASIHYPAGAAARLEIKGRPTEWRNSNSYTYELISPPINVAAANLLLQEAVEKTFGYTAEVKPSDMAYYEMSIDADALAAHNALQAKTLGADNSYMIGELMAVLSEQLPLPIENNAAYSGIVYIRLANSDFADLPRLKTILGEAGISLTEKQKNVPTLFIHHSSN